MAELRQYIAIWDRPPQVKTRVGIGAKLRQYIAEHKVGICIIVAIVLVLLALFALGVWRCGWGWTGFRQYTTQTITTEGTIVEIHPGKTLWDLMELLIIPLALGLVAWWLNRSERAAEREIASKRAETEREIAIDRQRQTVLDGYLDRMTDLLLKEGLRESQEGEEVRTIAQTRTLAVLRSLDKDGMRKGQVVRFLYESGVINRDRPIVDLDRADLVEVDLHTIVHPVQVIGPDGVGWFGWGLKLSKANLSGANLFKANFTGTDLRETDLSKATLRNARMTYVDLRGANLSKANLNEAHLSHSALSGADLTMAMFNGANLSGADLSGADLTRAMFNGANLAGATVDLEQITRDQLSGDTIMPDGTKYPEWAERQAKEVA